MQYKFVGGPFGANATIEGKAVGEEVTLSAERAGQLMAVGFQLEKIESDTKTDKDK